jgi:VWFA-related protein
MALVWPAAATALALAAMAAASPQVFSTHTDLVVLHVTVKDRSGAYVTGLPREAFSLFEDGRPQRLDFYAREDAPVTAGLIIDASGSMFAVRERVAAAAGAFAETSHERDEIFALAFNERVRPALPRHTPFTGDPAVLRTAVAGALSARGRTALYDAIAAGLDYVRGGTHLRRVLVVVSDGGDNASATTHDEVLRRAQVANTVIYTITVADPLDRGANPKRLRQLAEASGGEAFQPRSAAQIGEALQRIAEDIRNTYTLGYTPDDASDGRFHRLAVVAQAPGRGRLAVRTRQGYLAEQRSR